MHFPNIFIRFFAFVSSFLFPKHTHKTTHQIRETAVSTILCYLLFRFPVPRVQRRRNNGCRVLRRPTSVAAADWRTPTLSNALKNLSKLWQFSFPLPPSFSNYFSNQWKVVSFNVSVIEQEKWKRRRSRSQLPFCVGRCFPKTKTKTSHKHI